MQISISELKKLKAGEIQKMVPVDLTSDGLVIAVIQDPGLPAFKVPKLGVRMTQCPNCKLEYKVTPPDGRPLFLSGQHPH